MQRVALWLLALLVFSIPFENGVQIPGVGSISRMLGFAAFGAGVVALFERGKVRVRLPSLFITVALVFVLYSVTTLLWSHYPSVTFGAATTYVQLFLMAWLVWQFMRTERQAAFLMQFFVLGCYVTIAVAISSFFGSAEPGFRNVGGSFNPNEFSIVSAMGIPLAWYLSLRRGPRMLTWLNSIYPLFAVFGLLLSASRGGLLTTLVALAIIPLSLFRLGPARQLALFVVIAASTWTAFVQVPQLYPELERSLERLSSTTDELSEGDLTGRTTIWDKGLEAFTDSPVAGYGMGSFGYVVEPLLGQFKSAHNAFLSVAVGGGLLGVLLFTALVALAFMSAWHAPPGQRPFLIVLAAAMLVGMMPANSENDKHVWFLLALVAGMRPFLLWSRARGSSATLSPAGEGARSTDGTVMRTIE